ncbi:hypothetical protein TTHT_2010 [Thermotomaculum hydrothermale]|uniref:Uncharacterized protein n=1 Tax=Thermotomaculum hydrothermale TaxID=981385 RepID=A0A7R6T082_9BACT|nr:hypothetical protein [Thermotomaculum hydrothermale]BBB33452.1 hypothetical protein TTHT_2010 [Thermotomaculum hydrothermale]
MNKEKIILKVHENTKCSLIDDWIKISIFIVLFFLVNYGLFKLYVNLQHSWFGNSFPGVKGLLIFSFFPIIFNILIFFIYFAFPSNMIFYETFFEICYLFRKKRIDFKEIKEVKIKNSISGSDFEFYYYTYSGKKGFGAYYFSIDEDLKGKGANYVIQKLKKIFEEKGIPVVEK